MHYSVYVSVRIYDVGTVCCNSGVSSSVRIEQISCNVSFALLPHMVLHFFNVFFVFTFL